MYAPCNCHVMCLPVPRYCCSPAERTAVLPALSTMGSTDLAPGWSCVASGGCPVNAPCAGTVRGTVAEPAVISRKRRDRTLICTVENSVSRFADHLPRRLLRRRICLSLCACRAVLPCPAGVSITRPVGERWATARADLLPDELCWHWVNQEYAVARNVPGFCAGAGGAHHLNGMRAVS